MVTLPENAQSFFLRVFDTAARTPNASNLRQIYDMLEGACGQLLVTLSSEARHLFDKNLYQIICTYRPGQDLMQLLAFGIAVLAEPSATAKSGTRSPLPVEWTTKSSRKLFESLENVHKTIRLTYLHVVWMLKCGNGFSDRDAADGIRIAIRVLQSVDKATRERWPSNDPNAKEIYPKLPSKILQQGINPGVQLEARTSL